MPAPPALALFPRCPSFSILCLQTACARSLRCQVCFGFLPWSEFWAALPMGPCSCSQPGLIRSRARSQLLSRPTDSHDSPDHHVAPKGKISDQSLVELFLDMVAAERGGGKNTLAACASDLNDLSAAL